MGGYGWKNSVSKDPRWSLNKEPKSCCTLNWKKSYKSQSMLLREPTAKTFSTVANTILECSPNTEASFTNYRKGFGCRNKQRHLHCPNGHVIGNPFARR